jgi:3-dehydroquinate dehydratase-2
MRSGNRYRRYVAIVVLNGPNLDRLGTREPDVYGTTTYADLEKLCHAVADECDVDVDVRQTADEATMIGWLHQAADSGASVVINAAAWTHTSIAIRDAAAMLTAPWIEVHLSNVHAREEFRHHSYLSDLASGVIVGLGVQGYAAAIRCLAEGAR